MQVVEVPVRVPQRRLDVCHLLAKEGVCECRGKVSVADEGNGAGEAELKEKIERELRVCRRSVREGGEELFLANVGSQ